MTYRISLTVINFSLDCKCKCKHWNISVKYINQSPFTVASYNVTLLILGSLQSQRTVSSLLLPFLCIAREKLSVKVAWEWIRNQKLLVSACFVLCKKKFIMQSGSFNEQQGINSLLHLGHSQGGERTTDFTSVRGKIGKLFVFMKVTCQSV